MSDMSAIDVSDNPLDDGFLPSQEWFVDRILEHIRGFALDCGCGRGLWSKKLLQRGIEAVGLDLSLKRLKLCRSDGNNSNLVRGSSTCLPFRNDSFDSVLLIEVIEHVKRSQQEAVVSEIRRIMRVNGTFVMTTPNKHVYRMLTKVFFRHNPEHLGELTFGEAQTLMARHFELIDVAGKASGMNRGGILDLLVPTILRWDLLFVGRKPNNLENLSSIPGRITASTPPKLDQEIGVRGSHMVTRILPGKTISFQSRSRTLD